MPRSTRKHRVAIVSVVAVEVLEPYRLRLAFDDGLVREVDLAECWTWGPVFGPLRDFEVFKRVRVDEELGTIVWPNGADLDPNVLHGDFEPARTTHRTPDSAR